MKKFFSVALICTTLGYGFEAKAFLFHEPFFDWAVFDLSGAIGRTISAAIKYFLADDNELVAQLVYDGEDGKEGGCGGAYTGKKGDTKDGLKLVLNAVASPLTDIPAESGAYPEDIKIQESSIDTLADLRIKEIMKARASLDELSEAQWKVEYRAQQRAIQALTDALMMKKAYKELADIAKNVSSGSYSDYSEAASTVATRRLTLDALMALRKRVIAARVRARAEMMEANLDVNDIPSPPELDQGKSGGTDTSTTQSSTPTDGTQSGAAGEGAASEGTDTAGEGSNA